MSKHVPQQKAQEQAPRVNLTREQVLAMAGTALASGLIDIATHNVIVGIVGGCAALAAGVFTRPDVLRFFLPGSDPDRTVESIAEIAEQLAPYEDLPQDFQSKMRRLFNRPEQPEQLAQPKDEPANEVQRPQPAAPTTKGKPAPVSFAIPAQFKLDDVLDTIVAANNDWRIYFGQNSAGEAVTISIDEMYHVLDVSSSGKGKSNRFRLAMMQLVGTCEVYYINPLANRIKAVKDERKVEVWTPLFDRLANGKPMKTEEEIEQIMEALLTLIQDRYEREEADDFSWKDEPVFVFIDELPEIFARCPDAIEKLDKIGRTGRQFCVFAYVASQTAQVSEIGQSTAAQANYKTRVYGGGDSTSSKRLMKGTIIAEQEQALHTNGAGLTLMLAEGMPKADFVRAPLVTNEGMFDYLGLPFNLEDWLPSSGRVKSSRRGHALNLSDSVPSDRSQPRRRIDPEQPKEQKVSPITFETLMHLLQDNKIDLPTFQRLLDKIDVTEADVSRPVPSRDSEDAQISSEGPNLRLVGQDVGTVPAHDARARNEPIEPFPTMPDLFPNLGKDDLAFTDEQAAEFLQRYEKLPDVKPVLGQMWNEKTGRFGLGNRYYKHAIWLIAQRAKQASR